MIELIFVIVILGILASVAIPRLAATREDAVISATVANLRTLLSDASAYYAVKESFAGAKWKDITNVPLQKTNPKGNAMDNTVDVTTEALLGDDKCIGVKLVEKTATAPAHMKFTSAKTGVCAQVVAAAPVKAYIDSRLDGDTDARAGQPGRGAIAIGSSISIYD